MLVAARALQGAFGALLAPSALALLAATFASSPDRPKAFGIFGAIAGDGGSFGLLLGGALTQALSWRWCLYVSQRSTGAEVRCASSLLRQFRDVDSSRPERPMSLASRSRAAVI
jgi:MFS family permease